MIAEKDVAGLIELLSRRRAFVYHACQLRDLMSYIALWGVPSRAHLEREALPFTTFDTDAVDRKNGVWGKVFLNLEDFGAVFACGGRAVPNPYGPIVLVFYPTVLAAATDVAVCLRSAGGQSFNREAESLSLDALDQLFWYGARLKFAKTLAEEFGLEHASSPEISCSVPTQVLTFKHLAHVLVDPYHLIDGELRRAVQFLFSGSRWSPPILVRDRGRRVTLYAAVAETLASGGSIGDLVESDDRELASWADVVTKTLGLQVSRFSRYLLAGTLSVRAPEMLATLNASTPRWVLPPDSDETGPSGPVREVRTEADSPCPECGHTEFVFIGPDGRVTCAGPGCTGWDWEAVCTSCGRSMDELSEVPAICDPCVDLLGGAYSHDDERGIADVDDS